MKKDEKKTQKMNKKNTESKNYSLVPWEEKGNFLRLGGGRARLTKGSTDSGTAVALALWSRETGSAVPSRVSLLISILRLNLVLTYGIPPEFRDGVHLFI